MCAIDEVGCGWPAARIRGENQAAVDADGVNLTRELREAGGPERVGESVARPVCGGPFSIDEVHQPGVEPDQGEQTQNGQFEALDDRSLPREIAQLLEQQPIER